MPALSEPPWREPLLTDRGLVSRPWVVWFGELIRVIRGL